MKTGGMDAARKLRKKSPKVKQKKAAPPPPAPIATQPEARQSEGVGEQRLQNIGVWVSGRVYGNSVWIEYDFFIA